MISLHCCQTSGISADVHQQQNWIRRPRGITELLVPGALLVLMPKCPMCLAAYVAVATGFSMSFSSAHILMRSLTALCVGTLALCVVRRVVSCRHTKQAFKIQPTQVSR